MATSESTYRSSTHRTAFTLIELLVVVAIISLLVSILLPGLRHARWQAQAATCGSNLRQLAMANTLYANDHRDHYAPGATEMICWGDAGRSNLYRWYGRRDSRDEVFGATGGPLSAYLSQDARIRDCPSLSAGRVSPDGFEAGCGGYGYNQTFLGQRLMDVGYGFFMVPEGGDLQGVVTTAIRQPGQTVMFTDTALAANPDRPIQYSFVEPRYQPTTGMRADPSIQFRHISRTNVAWADGHVDNRQMTFSHSSGVYTGDPETFNIGWFGDADDNSLFDLQ